MRQVSIISGLLKKIYRIYLRQLLFILQDKGFADLRFGFLDILLYVCENEGAVIKDIGVACDLKKQTMTGHLNELQNRGYIERKASEFDRREQRVYLTVYGKKIKFYINEALEIIEKDYIETLGEVELKKINLTLDSMYQKILNTNNRFKVSRNRDVDFCLH